MFYPGTNFQINPTPLTLPKKKDADSRPSFPKSGSLKKKSTICRDGAILFAKPVYKILSWEVYGNFRDLLIKSFWVFLASF